MSSSTSYPETVYTTNPLKQQEKLIPVVHPPLEQQTSSLPTIDNSSLFYFGSKKQDVHQIAKAMVTQLDTMSKSTLDFDTTITILNSIPNYDLPLEILTKYGLGKLIKSIKKKAQESNTKAIVTVCDTIMQKWRELLPKDGPNLSNSPTPSPMSSPKQPVGQDIEQPASTPFRLAIQKEPPNKPKAITNTSFFDSLRGPSSSFLNTTRPSFTTQSSKQISFSNLLNQVQGSPSPKKRVIDDLDSDSTSQQLQTTKQRTRRVKFKPDHQLVSIREYEKDPLEWNFDATTTTTTSTDGIPTTAGHARDMDIREGQVMSKAHQHNMDSSSSFTNYQTYELNSNLWYTPRSIFIPDDCKPPWPKNSEEAMIQQEREKVTLAAVYLSLSHVPPTPAEPDDPGVPNEDTKIIPLYEVQTEENHIESETTSWSSSSQSNVPTQLLHPYQPTSQFPTQSIQQQQQPVRTLSPPDHPIAFYNQLPPQYQQQQQHQQQSLQGQPLNQQILLPNNVQLDFLMKPGIMDALQAVMNSTNLSFNNQQIPYDSNQSTSQQYPTQYQPSHYSTPSPTSTGSVEMFHSSPSNQQVLFSNNGESSDTTIGRKKKGKPSKEARRRQNQSNRARFGRGANRGANRGGISRDASNTANIPCMFYLESGCRFGDKCNYYHPE
ncbi:uncharacterized protein BX664DRAFT_339961 [Halteromyces radiatus]|uniref:uncharacterized protein n=1 Tax=Halteromyces radiatus TaxID=101107 RepID=UPI0022202FFD|nr:uncharacterized protein BX664DRAFT_339961 [Halteromyces radiatus]KAI8083172.1 hypothetical protein BX664DRAFT_339961 [Halteromyces radiatus]